MNKEEALKYLEEKGDSNFVIRTEEEETTYLDNYKSQVQEEYDKTVVPDKIKAVHDYYDKDIEEITGLKKEPTEKTYTFNKRVLKDYYERANLLTTKEEEIAALKKKIEEGVSDEQLKKDLSNMQKEYEVLKETSENKIKEMSTQHNQYRVRADIRAALSELAFDSKVPEAALRALQDSKVNEIAAMAQYDESGKLVFLDSDGVPRRNTHNKLEPYTAKELLAEGLKDVISEGGTPRKPNVSDEILKEYDDDGKPKKITLVVPDSVNTRSKLGEYLVSKGILRNTPEYKLAYREYGENMPMQ